MSVELDDQGTCLRCDGDGYLERWNDDQSGVIIEPCPNCTAFATDELVADFVVHDGEDE